MDKKLIEKLERMKQAFDEGIEGEIIKVETTTNKKFFDDKGNFDEREGISVTVKINSLDDEGTEFKQFFAIPSTLGYNKSNLAQFEKQYGSYPSKGIPVDVIINEDGFFRIVF
jgi:hypothetical protein